MIEEGPTLPFLALVWPLALACAAALPLVRRHAMWLLPLAPLPALWLGLTGIREQTSVPAALLGTELAAVPSGSLMLALTAGLWLAAGVFAQNYMSSTRKPAVFAAFWCLTLAGNIGVFLAADVVTFYVAFATVSLAAYVLIVHEGTEAALRAGRVYIVMVVLGEVCLLAAFIIGIAAAGSLGILGIRAALPGAPLGGFAAVLLVAGFGIKAGLMPLHVWLPLAHPAAPTPASAVLSGAIVKAGIMGLILFLPTGLDFAGWLVAMGLAGAFAGALLGLVQTNPKTILAYSTISQMSLLTAVIGAAAEGGAGSAQAAFYALHHGLAKGALFLSVGLIAACGGRWRIGMLMAVALVALSVAGAPLTGGSVAKLAVKSGLSGMAETALTLSAVTTTLVLARFLIRLASIEPKGQAARPASLLALPTLALALAALVLPWLFGPSWTGLKPGYPLQMSSLWSSAWPVAVGLGATALVWSRLGAPSPLTIGRRTAMFLRDWVAALDRLRKAGSVRSAHITLVRATARSQVVLWGVAGVANALEQRLRRGRHASLLLIILCSAIALGGWLWR